MANATRKKTPSRQNRDNRTGSTDHFRFMMRLVRKYGERAREEEIDIDTLTQLRRLRDAIETETGEVARAFNANGWSWGQIGDALGMDRSNAFTRYAVKK